MSILPVSALTAPDITQASSSSKTAQTQHKHGAFSLKGSFGIAASNALSSIGSASIGLSNNVLAALNNLKSSG